MERHASRGWFVNDLYRHAFAYHGFPLLARLLRVHTIVREDGQLSIARAFRPAEWSAMLCKAGVRGAARVKSSFPFRLRDERRSEEHTSELQSIMQISYAVLILIKINKTI